MAETFIYPRPNSAQGFYSANDVMRQMPKRILKSATPALGAALPQVATVVQEFTSADRFGVSVVCGGTIQQIGDSFGWLMKDEMVTTDAAYAIDGEWRCLLEAGAAPTVGADAYISTTTMEVTEVSGAGYEYIGKFTSAVLTNPEGLPSGDYADVVLLQTQL